MKTFKFIILFSALLAVFSCKKESKKETKYPTAQEFKALQDKAFESIIQKKTFKAEDGLEFTSKAGTKINITAGCLKIDESAVTGDVELRFAELYDRGTMLATNKTTVGKKADGSFEQLNSGGAFLVEVYKDGKLTSLTCPYEITVPANLTGGAQTEMTSFTGEIDENGNIVWETSLSQFKQRQTTGGAVYNALPEDFGWFNCDYFFNFPDPKTELDVRVPSGYNNENAGLYLAIKGRPNSLGYLYGKIPVGLEASVVVLSTDGDNFVYGAKNITVENGHVISFTADDLKTVTEAQLIAEINDLP